MSSVVIVSGNDPFLRQRFMREILRTKASQGWEIEYADAAVSGELERALVSGMFVVADTMVVVVNPSKANLEVLKRHAEDEEATKVLLLVYEGKVRKNTKFGKWAASDPRRFKEFLVPDKEYKLEDYAVSFMKAEAKRLKYKISDPLAQAIIRRAGTDLGVLHYELVKAGMLAELEGSKEITAEHVKGTLAKLTEASIIPVSDALGARNAKRLIRALDHVKQTTKNDPVIHLCRFLWASVKWWIGAAWCLDKGMNHKEAATHLGLNPWRYTNFIAPAARRWGYSDLVALGHALAISERAVLQGRVSPWVGLETRLLRSVLGR
jgi:DNA polymerase III delta subunit